MCYVTFMVVLQLQSLFVALANVRRACDGQKRLVLSRCVSTEQRLQVTKKKKGKQSSGLFGTPSGYPSKGTLTMNPDLN